jgi:hypothetical protein
LLHCARKPGVAAVFKLRGCNAIVLAQKSRIGLRTARDNPNGVKSLAKLVVLVLLSTSSALAAGQIYYGSRAGGAKAPPLVGCYGRLYDAAHLAAHKGQIVVRATLSIKSPPPEMTDNVNRIVASGDLKMWVDGRSKSFDSLGVCRVDSDGLLDARPQDG